MHRIRSARATGSSTPNRAGPRSLTRGAVLLAVVGLLAASAAQPARASSAPMAEAGPSAPEPPGRTIIMARRATGPSSGGYAGESSARPGGGLVVRVGVRGSTLTTAAGSTATSDAFRWHGLAWLTPTYELEQLWTWEIGGGDSVEVVDVAVVDAATAVVVGHAGYGFTGYPHGGFVELRRLHGAGWKRHLQSYQTGRGTYARSVALTADGGILAIANTTSTDDAGNPLTNVGITVRNDTGTQLARLDGANHLLKLSASGAIVWTRPISDARQVAVRPDGSIVLYGTAGLRLLGPDGAVRWRATPFELDGPGFLTKVHALDDGDIVVIGHNRDGGTLSNPLGAVVVPPDPHGQMGGVAVRFDAAGADEVVVRATGSAIEVDGSGRMIVAGSPLGAASLITPTGTSDISAPSGQALLLEATGAVQWLDHLPRGAVPSGFDGLGRVIVGVGADEGSAWVLYGPSDCSAPTIGAPTHVMSASSLAVSLPITGGSCFTPGVPASVDLFADDETLIGSTTVVSEPVPAGAQVTLTATASRWWDVTRPIATGRITTPWGSTTVGDTRPPCQPEVRDARQVLSSATTTPVPSLEVTLAARAGDPCRPAPATVDIVVDPAWDLSGLPAPWPDAIVGPGHLRYTATVGTAPTTQSVPLPIPAWLAGDAEVTVTATGATGEPSSLRTTVGSSLLCRLAVRDVTVGTDAPYPDLTVQLEVQGGPSCATTTQSITLATDQPWGLAPIRWTRAPVPEPLTFVRTAQAGSPTVTLRARLETPRWWAETTQLTVTATTVGLPELSTSSTTVLGAEGTATLEGTLLGVDGKPASWVLVSAYPVGDQWRNGRHTWTDDQGRYQLTVPAGAPTAVRVVDPARRFRNGWLTGTWVLSTATVVFPAADGTSTLDATLVPLEGGTVVGFVTLDGAPLAGVAVVLSARPTAEALPGTGSGVLALATTRANGSFTLDDVPPGTHRIAVLEPSGAEGWGWLRLLSITRRPQDVTVVAGEAVAHNLALTSSAATTHEPRRGR